MNGKRTMANDLSTMSKKQLEKLLDDVQKALKAVQVKERKEAKKAAEKAAAKFGFSLSELTDHPGSKSTRRRNSPKNAGIPKYANPDDPSQTWTGKGRQPQWYKDAIAAGKDPKSLEI
jgi:DNA-binding protein H-NS